MSYLRRWNGSSWEYVDAKNADYASSAGSADTVDGKHASEFFEKTGGTIDNGTSTTVEIKCDDTGTACLNVNGSDQGTGVVYVGQSSSYGGGLFYNGDGTPEFANGEGNDRVSFFRRSAGTNEVVFSCAYHSNTVDFKATPTVNGSALVKVITGTINHGSTIPLPSGYSKSQCKWIVSLRNVISVYYTNGTDDGARQYVWADQNRVVTAKYTGGGGKNGSANYIIIGVK